MLYFSRSQSILCSVSAVIFLCVTLLTACVPSPPESAKEEIVLHQWVLTEPDGTVSGSLCFQGRQLVLSGRVQESEFHLSGDYYLSDNTITVDSPEYGAVVFEYQLHRSELTLMYQGKSAKLQKSQE